MSRILSAATGVKAANRFKESLLLPKTEFGIRPDGDSAKLQARLARCTRQLYERQV